MDSQPVYSPAQLAARHQSGRRRAAAMCSAEDTIFGLTFHALTPETYSRLLVIESPFLWRAPAGASDVRDYLWLHWPGFSHSPAARENFRSLLEGRIAPGWLRWRYSRRAWHDRLATAYALAAVQITELVQVAFADEPPPSGESGSPLSASLEAQLIDVFARTYRWPPERTRATPLRQLYQFLRCADRIDYDADEAAIIAAELAAANAPRLSGAASQSPTQ